MTKSAKPRKKSANKPVSRDRVVYEVKGPQGTKQVDAVTTAELKAALMPLLGLEPYSVQATAHLVHSERVSVTGKGWSVKRLGVLAFVPDTESSTAPKTKSDKQTHNQRVQREQPSNSALLNISEEALDSEISKFDLFAGADESS